MTRTPQDLSPLRHFLVGDLDEIGNAAPDTVRKASDASGFQRAPLALKVRDSVIDRFRIDAGNSGFRTTLERFGVHPLRELTGANLTSLQLVGIDLKDADLSASDLSGSDLSFADLQNVDLRDARLRQAKLVGARLSRAQLTQADLTGADLSDAEIVGTSFAGAILAEAVGLPQSIRDAARIDPQIAALLYKIRPASSAGPASVTVRLNQAIDLVLAGNWSDAEVALRDLEAKLPSSPELLQPAELVRVVLLALQGDLKEAEARLKSLQ